MSVQKFDYIITQVAPNAPINALSKQLAKVLKREAQQLELQLTDLANQRGQGFPLLRNTSLQNVEKLSAFLNKYGIQGEHRESLRVEVTVEVPKYICPACNHQQEDDGKGICQKCGVVASRYESVKRKKDIFESERRHQQSEIQYNLDEAKKAREKAEEEALREEARRKLGIRTKRQQKTTQWLVGTVMVAAVSGGVYWYVQPNFSGNLIAAKEQHATAGQAGDAKAAVGDSAVNNTVKGTAGLTIQAQGGNLTVNLPEPTPNSAANNQALSPAQRSVNANASRNKSTTPIITGQRLPSMKDNDAQNLALSLYQQSQTESNPEHKQEALTKARLLAHSITSPQQRKALLQLIKGETWQVPNTIKVTNFYAPEVDLMSFEKQLEQANRQSLMHGERQLQQLMARTRSKGAYYQARLISRFLQSRYNQINARSPAQASTPTQVAPKLPARFLPYLDQIAKLAWQTPDPRQQVLIQGSLSQAYQLFAEEKLASMNLVMAVQNSRFINLPANTINTLVELARYQQQAKAYQAAHQLYQLAAKRVEKVPAPIRAEYYAKISQGFAKLNDINRAIALFEHIDQPLWLQKAMRAVDAAQQAQR